MRFVLIPLPSGLFSSVILTKHQLANLAPYEEGPGFWRLMTIRYKSTCYTIRTTCAQNMGGLYKGRHVITSLPYTTMTFKVAHEKLDQKFSMPCIKINLHCYGLAPSDMKLIAPGCVPRVSVSRVIELRQIFHPQSIPPSSGSPSTKFTESSTSGVPDLAIDMPPVSATCADTSSCSCTSRT